MSELIEYRIGEALTADVFIDLLARSGLAARRPVDDRECIEGMVAKSNLVVTAHYRNQVVGIARSMTDFHYACYLSDLAVDQTHQRRGIGRELIARTRARLGPRCKLILIAAPDADSYYGPLGFERNPRCWVLMP